MTYRLPLNNAWSYTEPDSTSDWIDKLNTWLEEHDPSDDVSSESLVDSPRFITNAFFHTTKPALSPEQYHKVWGRAYIGTAYKRRSYLPHDHYKAARLKLLTSPNTKHLWRAGEHPRWLACDARPDYTWLRRLLDCPHIKNIKRMILSHSPEAIGFMRAFVRYQCALICNAEATSSDVRQLEKEVIGRLTALVAPKGMRALYVEGLLRYEETALWNQYPHLALGLPYAAASAASIAPYSRTPLYQAAVVAGMYAPALARRARGHAPEVGELAFAASHLITGLIAANIPWTPSFQRSLNSLVNIFTNDHYVSFGEVLAALSILHAVFIYLSPHDRSYTYWKELAMLGLAFVLCEGSRRFDT